MKQVGFSFYPSHDSLIILLKLSIFNFLLSLNNYNSIQIVCFYGEDLAIKLVSKLFVLMYNDTFSNHILTVVLFKKIVIFILTSESINDGNPILHGL